MNSGDMWKLEVDWYSPTRLLTSPIQYDFPGDRFIPNRSLMDLDQAHSLLTNRTKQLSNSQFNEAYRQNVVRNLTLDTEGRPFRMLVFRGSPKSSRKSGRLIDEMKQDEADALNNYTNQTQLRRLPKAPTTILDAPHIIDDFYTNIMDWGKSNVLAIALGSKVYLWNANNRNVQMLLKVEDETHFPTSVSCSEDARTVAIGFMDSKLQLFDIETSKLVRSLEGHTNKVGTIAWNYHILASGSKDKSINTHDVRVRNNLISSIRAHTQEVCGLKWSSGSNKLASGGNENVIFIWEASRMSSSKFLHRFNDHHAAVKALAWCPYEYDILASGGGTQDQCIKIWDIQKGKCAKSINTKAQVSGLEWNRHRKEILSGHGYSTIGHSNKLCLWSYPSMSKVGDFIQQRSRILHLSQSPDGLTLASAAADQTLCFWEVFGPPRADDSRDKGLDALLSLKTSPIR